MAIDFCRSGTVLAPNIRSVRPCHRVIAMKGKTKHGHRRAKVKAEKQAALVKKEEEEEDEEDVGGEAENN